MKFKSMLAVAVSLSLMGSAVMAGVKRAVVYTEDNQVITVSKKSTDFAIKLASNPTTGYVWKLENADRALVVNTGHHFIPGNAQLIGSGGFDEWTFRALPSAFHSAHQAKLVFVYARPWEKNQVGKKVEFQVRAN